MSEGYDPYWESHEGELYEMYISDIEALAEEDGLSIEEEMIIYPFNDWRDNL